MKENLRLTLKGGFIGLANIIPGVSGGTMALTLGIYEKLINSISNFMDDIKGNIKFIGFIILGALIAIILGSSFINFTLEAFPIPTTLFFTGLITGGLPFLYKKAGNLKNKKSRKYVFIAFLLTAAFGMLGNIENVIDLNNMTISLMVLTFLVGCLAAGTMVVPGISGSLVLMMIGFYKPIVNSISELKSLTNITNNLMILIPLGLGIIIGILIISKLIEQLLKKQKEKTYNVVIGIVLGSIVVILKPVVTTYEITLLGIFCGLILANIGSYIALKLGE